MLLAVVSRVRLWKQQLSLFLPDPRDLEGVIWKSLQLLEPLSMEGIIPREVSHVSPCDAASVPIFLPALEFTQTSGLSSLVESYLPLCYCTVLGLWGCKCPSKSKWSQFKTGPCNQQNPTSFNPCPAAWSCLSLCCTVREGQQGRRGQRKSW